MVANCFKYSAVGLEPEEFENGMNKEFWNQEIFESTGCGQRFYRLDGILVTVTSPKNKYSSPDQKNVLIDIDNKKGKAERIRSTIVNRTGYKLTLESEVENGE